VILPVSNLHEAQNNFGGQFNGKHRYNRKENWDGVGVLDLILMNVLNVLNQIYIIIGAHFNVCERHGVSISK
jgi:hypothetical protein